MSEKLTAADFRKCKANGGHKNHLVPAGSSEALCGFRVFGGKSRWFPIRDKSAICTCGECWRKSTSLGIKAEEVQ